VDHVTQALLGIVAAGFLAWSAVVWKAAATAREMFIKLDVTLTAITARMEHLERRLEEHENSPWHPSAGTEIASLRRDVERVERTIENHGGQHS
jgi:hypothetical protein